MVKKFEIDENLIAMAAFTKIVKKFYKDLGANRSPEVIEKFKQAMISPESFCKLNFDPDDIQRKYANLKITVGGFDPNDTDADIIESDILTAYNEIDKIDNTQSVAVNTGRFLDMLDDKTFKYYKIGDFAPGRDDSYFMEVLDEKLKYYKPCDTYDTYSTDEDNTIGDVEQIAQKVKSEILSEIMQGLPKAFEKAMYTNVR